MSAGLRRRVRHGSRVISTGGVTPTAPIVHIGPDFGGVDGDRYNIGVTTSMPAVALSHEKVIGVHTILSDLGINYTAQTIGVHCSHDAAINYDAAVVGRIGVHQSMPAVAAAYDAAATGKVGVTNALSALAAAYDASATGKIGAHPSMPALAAAYDATATGKIGVQQAMPALAANYASAQYVAWDSSGNGFHGRLIGAPSVITSPWSGLSDAVDFDGVDSDDASQGIASIPVSSAGFTAFTLEAKARKDRTASEVVLTWGAYIGASQLFNGVYAGYSAGIAFVQYFVDDVLTAQVVDSGAAANGNHDFAVVWDGALLYLYHDGVRIGTNAMTSLVSSAFFQVWAARKPYDPTSPSSTQPTPFDGAIDDVRLSNSALYTGATYSPSATPLTVLGSTQLLWSLNQRTGNAGINVLTSMPSLALAADATATGKIGVHCSGSVIGAPFWQTRQFAVLNALSAGTSITVNIPASIAVGDLLIAMVGISVSGGIINTPSGWTAIQASQASNGNAKAWAFYRIVTGSEGSTQAFTWNNSSQAVAEIHHLRGAHATTPIDVSAKGGASVTDPVVSAVTTTVANCLVFYWVVHTHTVSQTHTPPASNTETSEEESDVASLVGGNSGYRIFAASGDTGTATVDCNEVVGSPAAYLRIAVRPGSITIA